MIRRRRERPSPEQSPRDLARGVAAGVLLVGLALCESGLAQEQPIFRLELHPCESPIEYPAGLRLESELEVRIRTIDNPDPGYGAQGWSLSIVVEEARATGITTKGTLAADITDDPPGLRSGGFERSALARDDYGPCTEKSGAITAVVLSFTEPITLPPEGPATVARLTVQADVPEIVGSTTTARVTFQDGCRGAGGPVSNAITHRGSTRDPERTACELEIVAGEPRFRRGDANMDGGVDLSDALTILGRLFLGQGTLDCRDAADSNDSGRLDVSDAIHILNFLFLGGAPPAAPGPHECGPDPTQDDALPDCRYDDCGED